MKIQTGFDKTLKEVYHILALPYPPRPIQSEELQVIEDEDEVNETAVQIKPFKPKFKSYNINKDELSTHRASKQLTKLIGELERKRRENDSNADVDANYIKYKENVVNLINHLYSRAKAEKAQNDSLDEGQLKQKRKALLSDVRRFSNALRADEQEEMEQARRVKECQDGRGRRATIELVTQLAPIHEQLAYFFKEENACAKSVVKKASSEDFTLCPSGSREKMQQISKKMEHILDSAELGDDLYIPRPLEGNIVKGAGKIGRSCKKGNDNFKSNLENIADNNRKKSVVHNELMVSLAKNAGNKEQKEAAEDKKSRDKMTVVLDTIVHKVKGKQVEKLRDEERKEEEFDRARQDTLEKISDYGKRKEVLENADTSYLTKTKHDEKSTAAKTNALSSIQKGGCKQRLNKVAQKVEPSNQSAGRLVTKERRPTGALPPGTFIKPVPLKQGGRQATSPNIAATGSRRPSAPPAFGTRKPSAPQAVGSRKPSGVTKQIGETSKKVPGTGSPGNLRKPSAPQIGRVSPGAARKPSGQQAAGKVSPSTTRKPSGQQDPAGVRRPSAGAANKPAAGPASKWR